MSYYSKNSPYGSKTGSQYGPQNGAGSHTPSNASYHSALSRQSDRSSSSHRPTTMGMSQYSTRRPNGQYQQVNLNITNNYYYRKLQ